MQHKSKYSIRIYLGAFRTSPVALHVEAYDPPLELRRNELGLRFLYKLKSSTTFTESLNTVDDREDQKYEVNKRENRPTEAYLKKKLEQIYMKCRER